MVLRKNGITYNLTDTIQIDAFIKSGWEKIDDTVNEEGEGTPLDFDKMTVEALKQYAAENNINISGAKTKAEIIELLGK